MASKHTCCNFALVVEDKLAKDISTKGNNSLTPSQIQTPIPNQAHTLAPALTSIPGLPGMYINLNLQKAKKIALKLFVKMQKHCKENSGLYNRA